MPVWLPRHTSVKEYGFRRELKTRHKPLWLVFLNPGLPHFYSIKFSVCLSFSFLLSFSPSLPLSLPHFISFAFPLCMPWNQVGSPELEGVIHNKLERWFWAWKKCGAAEHMRRLLTTKGSIWKKNTALTAPELHWNQYRGATVEQDTNALKGACHGG